MDYTMRSVKLCVIKIVLMNVFQTLMNENAKQIVHFLISVKFMKMTINKLNLTLDNLKCNILLVKEAFIELHAQRQFFKHFAMFYNFLEQTIFFLC